MIKPMRTLERHMRNAETGSPEPIPVEDMPRGDGEVASLFHGYNTLVRSERERANLAVLLAEEEKLSSLGRLASGMAHEINNPLGGLFNTLDTLKRHGQRQDVRAASIRLIERGLAGIRDVVEAALATYRPERSKTPLKEEDLDDLRLLVRSELHRKRLRLNWDVDWKGPETAAVPAGPVRQAVLNLLLNAIAATPEGGSIAVTVRMDPHLVSIAVADEGSGLPPEYAGILSKREPGPGTPVGRGLGLWMVRRVCDEMGGSVSVEQAAPRGTLVRLLLPAERKGEQAHAA
jgi:signal transduction histidine kinase